MHITTIVFPYNIVSLSCLSQVQAGDHVLTCCARSCRAGMKTGAAITVTIARPVPTRMAKTPMHMHRPCEQRGTCKPSEATHLARDCHVLGPTKVRTAAQGWTSPVHRLSYQCENRSKRSSTEFSAVQPARSVSIAQ